MKTIFKLFPAALALVTLASCSNDDTLGSSEKLAAQKTMNVSVEELQIEDGAATRAAYYATATSKNAFRFLEGDKINVYDNNLAAYDEFTLGADSKWATTTSNVTEHKFGVYPATRWENHGWTPGGLRASVLIPRAWNQSKSKIANSYTTNKETIEVGSNTYEGYTSNVPVWGATTDDATNVLNMDMKYLTAMLKISLSQVSDASAKWVRIVSDVDHPISGYFYAILAAGTTPELTKVTDNEALQNYYTNGNEIIVALPGGTAAYDYCVYVPIISGVEYPSLKVQYGTAETSDPNDVATWTNLYQYTNKTFNRGTIYSSGLSARFYASTELWPEGVNAFAQVADQNNLDIVVNAATLNVKKDANLVGNHTIDLPATSKNVTLEFTDVKEKATSPETSTLTIQGANFTGDFTLKLAHESGVEMNINLPKANKVTLVGTYATVKKVTVKEAKKLVFGDGSTTTTATAATTDSKLVLTKITEGIEVAHSASITGTLDITGANVQVPVTIGGAMESLKTKKNVTVNTIEESIAIGGTLYFSGTPTLTLKQGLINAIDVAQGTANVATLVNPEGQGIAAIKSVNVNETATFKTEGVSKWNGEEISAANAATYMQGDHGEIWTASQFATWKGSTAANLKANIDLQNKDYASKTLTNVAFDGGNFTISNVGNANATNGLFVKVTGTEASISNLKVDGITVTKKELGLNDAPIGALVGFDDATASTYTNVTLTNINLGNVTDKGKEYAVAIGGLIGKKNNGSSNTTIEKCKVSGSIKGYAWLGGFIGKLSWGNVNFKNSESAVAFTFGKTYVKADDNKLSHVTYEKNAAGTETLKDTWAGTIGTFVGTIYNSDNVVEFDSQCKETVALNKSTLKFDNNWMTEATSEKGVKIDQFFHGKTSLVGYCEAFKKVSFFNAQGVKESYNGTGDEKKAFNLYSQTKN